MSTNMSGNPEALAELLVRTLAQGGAVNRRIDLAVDDQDNEIVNQVFLSTFKSFIGMMPPMDLSMLFDSFNMALIMSGFRVHYRVITSEELANIVYYSKLTHDNNLVKSQFHPIHLRSLMPAEQIPESFDMLFNNRDYLPNIINVWERAGQSPVMITFQKVNVHYGSDPTTVDNAINTTDTDAID